MIISHQYRFIFVKTAKTAGTSIEMFLSPICGPDDILTPFHRPEDDHVPRNYMGMSNPLPELRFRKKAGMPVDYRKILANALSPGGRKFFNHIPAWLIRARAPLAWHDYLTFTVVRHPYDVAMSGFFWHRANRKPLIGFDDYLDSLERIKAERRPGFGSGPFNLYLYVDPQSGRPMVDRILRYERLDTDLAAICGELNIPFPGKLPARAKSGVRPAREIELTRQQKDRLCHIYAEEFDLHGYTPPV